MWVSPGWLLREKWECLTRREAEYWAGKNNTCQSQSQKTKVTGLKKLRFFQRKHPGAFSHLYISVSQSTLDLHFCSTRVRSTSVNAEFLQVHPHAAPGRLTSLCRQGHDHLCPLQLYWKQRVGLKSLYLIGGHHLCDLHRGLRGRKGDQSPKDGLRVARCPKQMNTSVHTACLKICHFPRGMK